MNSKAIRKQLLAAVAMVLVAAVALGSSTYAWFVASGSVTAKGMNVKAQSEGGLIISYGGEVWGTSATAGMTDAKELYPASTADLANWYHATAAQYHEAAALAGSRTNVTPVVFGGSAGEYDTNNSYVVMREFKIKSASSSTDSKGLFVESVDVTGYKTMSTALRVGVKYKPASGQPPHNNATKTSFIYGPVKLGEEPANKPSDGYTVYREKTDDPTTSEKSVGTVTLDTVGKTGSTLIAGSQSIPSNSELIVEIYIWFEGEDHNLRSNNFNPEDLSVTVSFSSISGSTASTGSANMYGAIADTTPLAAKDPATGNNANFYKITNKTGLNNEVLYAKTSGALTGGNIYTITEIPATEESGSPTYVATQYTKIDWTNPAPAQGEGVGT